MISVAEEHLGVAVVDDDPIFLDMICATLEKTSNFVLFPTSSGDGLLDVLSREQIDCVVLDYELDRETGLSIKRLLDETIVEPPPSVMLTGDGRESTAIRAFRMGVDDYLPKNGLRPEFIVASVIKAVERHRRELETKADHRRLLAASSVDFVTGLESRARLDERLIQLTLMAPEARHSLGLILVDLVEYDNIIDRLGLKTADNALRVFAKQLQKTIRSHDICGRYANGTFMVIADVEGDLNLLRSICGRLTDQLSMRLSIDWGDLTLSAHVAGALCAEEVQTATTGVSDLVDPMMLALSQVKAAAAPINRIDDALSEARRLPSGIIFPANTDRRRQVDVSDASAALGVLRMADRRSEPRQRVLKRGLIHFKETSSTFNCAIRNLSSRGACLRTDATCVVPATFNLEIFGSGVLHEVRVCWQHANDIGVEIVNIIDTGKIDGRGH